MTHPFKGFVAMSAAALFLTGCDDLFSSGDSSTPTPDDDTPPVVSVDSTYDDQIIQINDLNFDLAEVSTTPADQMPITGAAVYEGVVGFSNTTPASGNISEYDMMSDLTLQADFATGGVTGTMDNFNTRGDVDMDGSLTLTEGTITGTSFTANAIGSFTEGTTAEIWDLDVRADFMGASGTAIEGTANGTISNGGSLTTEVFGDMIAVQN
jgi:hypothetical protein